MNQQLRCAKPACEARRAFYLLVGVAGASVGILLALFVSAPSPFMYVAELCYLALTRLGAQIYAWRWGFPAFVLALISFAFLASVLHKTLSTYQRVQQILGEERPLPPRLERLAAETGLAERLHLIRSDQPVLFSFGLGNPQVCVSTRLVDQLDDEELQVVLWHELYHVRQRDPLRILLAMSLARGLFFIPTIRDLHDAYVWAKELAADDESVERMGDPAPLARALLKLLASDKIEMPAIAVTAGALNVTQDRIDHLLNRGSAIRTISTHRAIASGVVILAISFLSLLPVELAHAQGIAVGASCQTVEEASQG